MGSAKDRAQVYKGVHIKVNAFCVPFCCCCVVGSIYGKVLYTTGNASYGALRKLLPFVIVLT
jgi:hypothetical protein